ncbi:MAG: single-stranded-DNA-specific exonuclease RecJ [Saprospiraceae bacterium]|nr:single-stranded-DNA-specific exonuclease RecJ [Saprospiraceae bacterium]
MTPNAMTSHRWQLIPTDEEAARQLQEALGIAPLFCRLLVQRDIRNYDEARRFFRPDIDDLHDPFLMKDMDLAVERLDRALQSGERILLYGDYDVDGTTSVSLMYAFLSAFYRNLDYYLPDREKEGYGVSLASVEYARTSGATLVIAMDCGIKAHEAVSQAQEYGIDFIICDHHLPEGDLPGAVANLDPKREDCPYPYKELSGCGIAFKLAQALAMHNNTPREEINDLLDLVATSIACDIVPMSGENRILAFHGLKRLNRSPRIGLRALIEAIKRPPPLEVKDLVFGLGPLINAAGRLGDARDAVRLLLSADRHSAEDSAARLIQRNHKRREVDYAMAGEAKQRFTEMPDWEQRKSIVLYSPDWHKGIIGIAASRMTESFHRPSVILTCSNDRAVGSARSVPGFDLYEALRECEDLFFSYGGHAHAAGMQMPVENVPAFSERFEQIACRDINEENAGPVIDISVELRLDDITPQFRRLLRQFEPFGPQNRSPVFVARGLVDTGHSRRLDNNHIRLSLRHADSQVVLKGIGFGLADAFEAVQGAPFDMAFNLREEQWRGERVLSLQAKSFQPSAG